MLMLSVPCGHSLALYFTQVNFSPSSSKLWMWFWFLCLVWRRWISFNQHLHAAHVICPPSFHERLSVLELFLCLTGIVSTTSTCFILLFMFTSRIHAHECFLSPVLLLDSWNLCHSSAFQLDALFRLLAKNVCIFTLSLVHPAGNFRKKKVSLGKTSKRKNTEWNQALGGEYFPFTIPVKFMKNYFKLAFLSFRWISWPLHNVSASHAYLEKYIDFKLQGFPTKSSTEWVYLYV